MKRPLRGVLVDIDGTLLDSNAAHAHAWIDSLAEEGITIELNRVQPLIGKGGDKVLPELSGIEEASDRGKRIAKRRGAIFKERYLASCAPFPGARELLERMRDEGLVRVVATSAGKDELKDLLHAANVHDLFDEVATSSDAEQSKPDPDIVQAALRRSHLSPDEALMLGDTPYDVEAAGRAGMRAIAVRSGGWDVPGLATAAAIYQDVADLLARYDESPLARVSRSK